MSWRELEECDEVFGLVVGGCLRLAILLDLVAMHQ